MMPVECETPIAFDAEEELGVYVSSDWGGRLFCIQSGSSLVWRSRDGTYVSASSNVFEDPGRFRLGFEIFADEKSANYEFANDATKIKGAEVLDMVMASKEL